MIVAESSHIFQFNAHSSTNQVTEKATDTHAHTAASPAQFNRQCRQTEV